MVPFAGYNMPVQYTGVNQEHIHVRSAVGVFDVSHMGEVLRKRRRSGAAGSKSYHKRLFRSFLTVKFNIPAFQMEKVGC